MRYLNKLMFVAICFLACVCWAKSGKDIHATVDQLMRQGAKTGSFLACMNYLRGLTIEEYNDFINYYCSTLPPEGVGEGAGLRLMVFTKCYLEGPLRELTPEAIIADATSPAKPTEWKRVLAGAWRQRLPVVDRGNPKRLESLYRLWEQVALSPAAGELRNTYAEEGMLCAKSLLALTTKDGKHAGLERLVRSGDLDSAMKKIEGDSLEFREIVKTAVSVSTRASQMLRQIIETWPKDDDRKKQAESILHEWESMPG